MRLAILIAAFGVASPALANQGLFGGRQPEDGSLNIRRSTTDQFNPIRGQSVAERARPDFDPTPLALGSFQLFPSINLAGYYDSNIYASRPSIKGDVVSKINPALSAVSNWGRHALAFTGVADINTYINNNEENYTGGAMQADGRLDFAHSTWLSGAIGYQRVTEPRSSPSVPGAAAQPTQYNLFVGGAQAYRGTGKLKATAGYDFLFYDYGKVQLVMPGGVADETVRSRYQHKINAGVEYNVAENLKPFLRGGFDWRDYTNNAVRSSTGGHIDAGAKMDFGGKVTAEAYIGFIGRDYSHMSKSGVNAFDFGGTALWNITALTSLQGEIARSVEETTVGGALSAFAAISYISTGGSLTLTHELRRNIVIEADAAYTEDDFQNLSRTDNVYDIGVGGRYFFNRNFYSDLTYDFITRDSNAAAASYDRHIAMLRFGAQY